jgi:hypothetical protein
MLRTTHSTRGTHGNKWILIPRACRDDGVVTRKGAVLSVHHVACRYRLATLKHLRAQPMRQPVRRRWSRLPRPKRRPLGARGCNSSSPAPPRPTPNHGGHALRLTSWKYVCPSPTPHGPAQLRCFLSPSYTPLSCFSLLAIAASPTFRTLTTYSLPATCQKPPLSPQCRESRGSRKPSSGIARTKTSI